MGKSIRDYRKNRADELLAFLDSVITTGYKVTWMGKSGVSERLFETHSEALSFSRNLNTAGCTIEPL